MGLKNNLMNYLLGLTKSFRFFYAFLKYRIFIILGASVFVGVLDGFGLAMIVPLLEVVDKGGQMEGNELGSLSFVFDFLRTLNLPMEVSTIVVVLLLFFILKGVFKFFEGFFRVTYQQKFMRMIRDQNADMFCHYKYSDFVLSDAGKIQNTFSAEVLRVNQAFQTYFLSAQALIMICVYLGLAFGVNSLFAILVSIGGLATNVLFKGIYKQTKVLSRKLSNEANSFHGVLMQMVSNFKYLKSTSSIVPYTGKLKQQIKEIERVQKRLGILDSILQAAREPLIILVVAVVIFIQVNIFGDSLGSIILSLLFLYRALSFVMAMQKQWNGFLGHSGALDQMVEFRDELRNSQESFGELVVDKFINNIELRNVSFSYDDLTVLKGVDLTIEKNQSIAVVGESGSGKTTLINLICGLIRPSIGTISLDGNNYEGLYLPSLQKRLGYITQEPVIFSDSIFNNVTFWTKKTPEVLSRFQEALKKASIYDFVMSLKNAEETILGTSGINLSGGQKQRLSIARELFKNVDILILDEATSALDTETEKEIQESIDVLKGKYTLIVVAHRLSTIRNVDRVLLLSEGEVKGQGAFNELYVDSDIFKRMVSSQNY